MRKLMWFTVGAAAAAAICAYLFCDIQTVYIAIATAGCSVMLLHCKNKTCAVAAVALLGFAAGMLYSWGYDRIVLSKAKSYDGERRFIQFRAEDYSFSTDYGFGVDGVAELNGRSYTVRLYIDEYRNVEPGDQLIGRVQLRYTGEGGLKQSTYHKAEGIYLLASSTDSMKLIKAESQNPRYFAAYLRRSIVQRIELLFSEDVSFFAKALLLGDDSQISFRDDTAFQKSGIRHIIAVSGLHVSVLYGILYFLFGRRKGLLLMVGIPVLFLFAAVAGFSPSVVRACIMQGLVILAITAEREYDPVTALSFAVLVILTVNPVSITAVSFQLSVGCMIGIFAFSQHIRDYFYKKKPFGSYSGKSLKGRLIRWLVGSVSVTLSTMTVTLPLCILYFDTISVIGIVTNLLTLSVVSAAFCGIIAACVLSLLWMPLGVFAAWIVAWPLRYVLLMARLLANIPFGVVYTGSVYTVTAVVLFYGLLVLFFISGKKRPIWLAVSTAILYGMVLIATWAEPRLDNLRLSVLDVGQGQCVLLQSKDQAYLIDCGGEDPERTAAVALEAMGSQGLTKLDGLILTHFDKDHCNGAPYLLEVAQVEKLYLPDADEENLVRLALEDTDVPIQWVRNTQQIECKTGTLQIIPAEHGKDGNESSMCILFRGENCDILITGDRDLAGESLLLRQERLPDIEILVAGHHGAATSTGLELLKQTRPELVLISVGADNLHGHPDTDTLSRLEKLGCMVRRTDQEGTIIVRE